MSPVSPVSVTNPKHPERRREVWRRSGVKKRATEAGAFNDLRQALPVAQREQKTLDKLAVLRVTSSYIKLRGIVAQCFGLPDSRRHGHGDLLNVLGADAGNLLGDAFLIILGAADGEIIYVSENGAKVLGCEQVAILGTSIYDHIQELAHCEVQSLLTVQHTHLTQLSTHTDYLFKTEQISAVVHLAKPGQLRPLQITGKLFLDLRTTGTLPTGTFFVGLAEPQPPLLTQGRSLHDFEYPFPTYKIEAEIRCICTVDLKCIWGDIGINSVMGYTQADQVGVSVFEFIHADDLALVRESWDKLYDNSANGGREGLSLSQSPRHRILAKGGGWAWFACEMYFTQLPTRGADGAVQRVTYCVGRFFMLSEIEERDKVLGAVQLRSESRSSDLRVSVNEQQLSFDSDSNSSSCVEVPLAMENLELDYEEDLDELLNFIGPNSVPDFDSDLPDIEHYF